MAKTPKPQPASQCPKCGTWRTPGQTHTPKDTGPVHKNTKRTCDG